MRAAVVVAAAGLIATACSGDGSTASTTVPVVETSSTTTTTAEVTPTTVAPEPSSTVPRPTSTEVAPTSTDAAPTTVEVPTTLPDGMTPAEFDALRDQVIADLTEANELFDQVRQSPTDANLLAQMALLMTRERIDEVTHDFVVPYVTNNLFERTNPELPARNDFFPDTFSVDLAAGTASIRECYLSSNLLLELGGSDDGGDKLQDDRFGAVLLEDRAVFNGTRWLDDSAETLSVTLGEVECDLAAG